MAEGGKVQQPIAEWRGWALRAAEHPSEGGNDSFANPHQEEPCREEGAEENHPPEIPHQACEPLLGGVCRQLPEGRPGREVNEMRPAVKLGPQGGAVLRVSSPARRVVRRHGGHGRVWRYLPGLRARSSETMLITGVFSKSRRRNVRRASVIDRTPGRYAIVFAKRFGKGAGQLFPTKGEPYRR